MFRQGPASWMLTSPGQEFLGEAGEWELEAFEDDTIGSADPFWLLEVIAAATDATAQGKKSVLGEPCQRYRIVSSLALARMQAKRPMGPEIAIGVQPR
jgi:hypothetical protein